MKNTPIGILDMNTDNIAVINYLHEAFPHEHFIYIYDPDCLQYEGLPEEEINIRVQKNLDYLMLRQVKMILTVSNAIYEYCKPLLDQIPVPVVNIVDSIVDEVNNSYEHKNMVFLANELMVQSNLYQKNLKYNHLYAIFADSLNNLVKEQKMKTSESFRVTRDVFRLVIAKDVDLIIPVNVNLMLLRTEIHEYLPEADILDLGQLLVEKTKAALLTTDHLEHRGKGIIELPQLKKEAKSSFEKILLMKHIIWMKNN